MEPVILHKSSFILQMIGFVLIYLLAGCSTARVGPPFFSQLPPLSSERISEEMIRQSDRSIQPTTKNSTDKDEPEIEAILSRMTHKQLIGQMLMFGIRGREVGGAHRRFFERYAPGGIILFSRNIWEGENLKRMTAQLQELSQQISGVPLFLAVDQEGGRVVRLRRDATVLPSQMAVGATQSPRLAYRVGRLMGKELRALGINMNFSPVLDLYGIPGNPMIGIRSFGEDPQNVATLGSWYAKGMRESGILAVAKHFPGHGATVRDTHRASTEALATLQRKDLYPFEQALKRGIDAVMTAHVAYPSLDGGLRRPATLSPRLLNGLLRKEFGFGGLIITDDLEMGGLREYEIGEAAALALKAGADILMVAWTAAKQKRVYEALLSALERGEISQERLKESVRRILTVKFRLQKQNSPAVAFRAPSTLSTLIARGAVTLVKNEGSLLPLLPHAKGKKILLLSPLYRFDRNLIGSGLDIETLPLPLQFKAGEAARFAESHHSAFKRVDLILMAVLNRSQAQLAQWITLHYRAPMIGVSLGEPELLQWFPKVSAYLCAYSFTPGLPEEAARVILGLDDPRGKLPVTISEAYPVGHGLSYTRSAPLVASVQKSR